MKKQTSQPSAYPAVLRGIALGGPYCGSEFRTVLEGVIMPTGAYCKTDRTDRQGRTIYKWHPGDFEVNHPDPSDS